MDNELKPCPFCGGKTYKKGGYETGKIACDSEYSVCPIARVGMTPERWNTRPSSPERKRALERLKHYCETLRTMKGLDHENPHTLLGGTEKEANLYTADIELLCQSLQQEE